MSIFAWYFEKLLNSLHDLLQKKLKLFNFFKTEQLIQMLNVNCGSLLFWKKYLQINNKQTKKGYMYIWEISIHMANPRTCTNLILPLLIQNRRRNCYVDKITAVFGFKYLLFFSVYWASESVMRQIWILPFIWHWEQLSTQQPHWAFKSRTPKDNFSLRPMWNIAQLNSNHSFAELVVLSVCSVVCLYAIKYQTLRPVI